MLPRHSASDHGEKAEDGCVHTTTATITPVTRASCQQIVYLRLHPQGPPFLKPHLQTQWPSASRRRSCCLTCPSRTSGRWTGTGSRG